MPILSAQTVRFERLGLDTEPNYTVCMVQDARGYLWFGTFTGLYRYDGYSLDTYTWNWDDPGSLPHNWVWTLFEDRDGSLWIGTDGGLARFDHGSGSFDRFPSGPEPHELSASLEVRALAQTEDGAIWVGTLDHGLFRFDSGTETFTQFKNHSDRSESLADNRIRALVTDGGGTLWVGTADGLDRFDPTTGVFTHYRLGAKGTVEDGDNDIRCLQWDAKGYLWVGTTRGLKRFEPLAGVFERYLHTPEGLIDLGSDAVLCMAGNRSGDLWIGTGRGLDRFESGRGRLHRFFSWEGVDKAEIRSVLEDRSGTLWLGTNSRGILKHNRARERFAHFGTEALPSTNVRAIYEDPSHLLWVGTTRGLARINRKSGDIRHYTHDPGRHRGIGQPPVWAIAGHDDGTLWLGTNSGLATLNRRTEKFTPIGDHPSFPKGARGFPVFVPVNDREGRLWAGTSGGGLLGAESPEGPFWHYTHEPDKPSSLSHSWVRTVHHGQGEVLWVGTDKGGLNRFDMENQTFERFLHDSSDRSSLSANRVLAVYEDLDGSVWIGTDGGGLNRLDQGTGRISHYSSSTIDTTVYGILNDESGNLWLSTNRGIVRFDPREESVHRYDRRDGLQDNEFNATAYFRNAEGELFFGGINGLNIFHPRDLIAASQPPQTAIVGVQRNNRPVPLPPALLGKPGLGTSFPQSGITLRHTDRVISFEFSALHFANPGRNRFAYRLEGFQSDWVETEADRREATYTNLDPGSYVFRVKSRNPEGLWDENGVAVAIEMLPAPWKTVWAYMVYGMTASLALLAFVHGQRKKIAYQRSINQRLVQVDKLKDEFLGKTSHELRTPLHGMVGMAEALRESLGEPLTPEAESQLSMIVASGRRLALLVDDILDFSRLKHGSLRLFRAAVDLRAMTGVVFTQARYLIGNKNLELVNGLAADLPPVDADENRLQQILYNLIGNAIKFTEAGTVTVTSRVVGRFLEIGIADTGIGIDACDLERIFEPFDHSNQAEARYLPGTGLGLTVTRQLVRLHGGTIRAERREEGGTAFTFTLPVSQGGKPAAKPGHLGSATLEAAAPQLPVKSSRPHPGTGKESRYRLLVVDDDTINRQVLVHQLARKNVLITEAANGREALSELEKATDIDLVLLDIMMPGMSGYQVCRTIRRRHSAQELPIIFLTAKDRIDDLLTGLGAGANDYLTKPIHRNELIARVETQLRLLETHRSFEREVSERTREIREMTDRKSKWLTELSHEFRTPLTLIVGPLQDLLAGKYGEINLPQRAHLEMALRNAHRQLDLVDRWLELVRMEANAIALKVRPGNLVSFVRERVAAFAPWAEHKNLDLEFQSDFEEIDLYFDPGKLETVLFNLLSNAFKFTPESGKISVAVGREGPDWAWITVLDTGVGIEEEHLPFLFDRYYRVQRTKTEHIPGSGIGLSLVKDILDLHRGEIRVASKSGSGAEFRVRLPARTDAFDRVQIDEQPPPFPETGTHFLLGSWARHGGPALGKGGIGGAGDGTASPNKPSVLVIEDHEDMRAFLRTTLQEKYNVCEAPDGSSGLSLALEKRPELILCDILMADLDGLTLTETLKTDERTRTIPLIILTAKASEPSKLQGLQLGADDYLTKPFSTSELLARMENLIQSRKALRDQYRREAKLQPTQVVVPTAETQFLKRLGKVLEERLDQVDFGVLELADQLAVSVSVLHRKVKASTGKGPGFLIRRFRMERAAQLLLQEAGTVSEIAGSVGYRDVHQFSKVFRKTFGRLPSDYRKELEHHPV